MKTIIIMLGLAGVMYFSAPAQLSTMSITPMNQINSGNNLNNPNLNQGANYNNNYNNSNYNHSPNYYQNQIGNPYEQNNNLNNPLAPVNNMNNNNTMTPFNNTTSPYDFTSPYYTPPASTAPLNGVPPVR